MGKRKNKLKKQYRKHGLPGETAKEFMIRHSGNIRPEQHPIEKVDAVTASAIGAHVTAGLGVATTVASQKEKSNTEALLALNDLIGTESGSTAQAESVFAAAQRPQEAPAPINLAAIEDDAPIGSLAHCTVAELKRRAKDRGVPGYSKMRKAELVQVLS
jgi:hypothetical protein